MQGRNDETLELEQAIARQSWREVLYLVRKNHYRASYSHNVVIRLIENENLEPRIRFGAYLYLAANQADLEVLKRLAPCIDLRGANAKCTTIPRMAIKHHYPALFKWLNEQGLVSKSDIKFGYEQIKLAIIANDSRRLKELITDFGLPLRPKSTLQPRISDLLDLLLLAIKRDRITMLKMLIDEFKLSFHVVTGKDHAFGLGPHLLAHDLPLPGPDTPYRWYSTPLSCNPLHVAFVADKLDMLKTLIKPSDSEGFGLGSSVYAIPFLIALLEDDFNLELCQQLVSVGLKIANLRHNDCERIARKAAPNSLNWMIETLFSEPLNEGESSYLAASIKLAKSIYNHHLHPGFFETDEILRQEGLREKLVGLISVHYQALVRWDLNNESSLSEESDMSADPGSSSSSSPSISLSSSSSSSSSGSSSSSSDDSSSEEDSDSLMEVHPGNAMSELRELLNELSPGLASKLRAEVCSEREMWVDAYECYLALLNDADNLIELRMEAAKSCAEMILKGDVILNNDGELDSELTNQQSHASDKVRKQEGLDNDVMIERAIQAYDYLQGDLSPDAAVLRAKLDSILCGELKVLTSSNLNQQQTSQLKAYWKSDAVDRFFNYYVSRDPSMLNNPRFIESYHYYRPVAPLNYSRFFAQPETNASNPSLKRTAEQAELGPSEQPTKKARPNS